MTVLTAGLLTIIAGLLMLAGYLAMELDRLKGGHAARARVREAEDRVAALVRSAPPLQRHHGRHLPRRGPVPVPLLTPEQVAGHADAMFAASEEYLPDLPTVAAWQPVERVRTEDHAPWTGSQIALDAEAEAEMDRVRYVRAQLAECGDRPTAGDLRRVLDSLRRPVYGEAPQLAVDEAGRLTGRVIA